MRYKNKRKFRRHQPIELNKDSRPAWLSEEVLNQAKTIYLSHKDIHDGLRLKAIEIIREEARKACYHLTYGQCWNILIENM